MQSNCNELISILEQHLKNHNYAYLPYKNDETNIIKYSFNGKIYLCNKNPSEINLENYNKLHIDDTVINTDKNDLLTMFFLNKSGMIIYKK